MERTDGAATWTFTDSLREEVRNAAKEMHELFQRGYTPNVKPTKKCKACSLENLCLPKLQKDSKSAGVY